MVELKKKGCVITSDDFHIDLLPQLRKFLLDVFLPVLFQWRHRSLFKAVEEARGAWAGPSRRLSSQEPKRKTDKNDARRGTLKH